jgi:hypothetical protein
MGAHEPIGGREVVPLAATGRRAGKQRAQRQPADADERREPHHPVLGFEAGLEGTQEDVVEPHRRGDRELAVHVVGWSVGR